MLKASRCSQLSLLENTKLNVTSYSLNGTATMICNEGFQLSLNYLQTRYKTANTTYAEWKSQSATCIENDDGNVFWQEEFKFTNCSPIYCNKSELKDNYSQMATSLNLIPVGTKIDYSCSGKINLSAICNESTSSYSSAFWIYPRGICHGWNSIYPIFEVKTIFA